MKTVFFDVDTQLDFLLPAGALPVPGASALIPVIARLNRFAREHRIPLISTMDAHSEQDPEFQTWPPHCVSGTLGQRKPESTLCGQIILEKQALDCFSVETLPGLLDELRAEKYVVYGVVTEVCVRFAAAGLQKTGALVEIVTDATMALDADAQTATFAEIVARGGALTTVDRVTA